MKHTQTSYPDISDLLALKEERRRGIARLSLGEKIARIEALRERLAPLKKAREERRKGEARGRVDVDSVEAPQREVTD